VVRLRGGGGTLTGSQRHFARAPGWSREKMSWANESTMAWIDAALAAASSPDARRSVANYELFSDAAREPSESR
jgi:hypothetical protein